MKSLITFVVTVQLTIHGCIAQNQCKNYHNQPGSCIPIASCKSLHQLDQNPNKSFNDLLLINGNLCGSGSVKRVCCTDAGSNDEPTVVDRAPFGGVNVPIKVPSSIPSVSASTTTSRTPVTSGDQGTNTGLLPIPGGNECGIHFPDKIVGGTVAAIDEHPWLARLECTYPNGMTQFRCGGALINSRYVLTAAHCIPTASDDFTLTGVRLGEWNAATRTDCYRGSCSDPPQDISVEKIITYPDYVPAPDFYHDIALLRLATAAQYSVFVRPICLPSTQELRNANDFNGKRFEVSGWGKTETSDDSDLKLRVDVAGVTLDTCNWIWRQTKNPITERQICAGGETGKDSCQGDSGGPLMLVHRDGDGNNFLYAAGIVSYGLGCGLRNWPGIYTKVGSYMDWIEANVKP